MGYTRVGCIGCPMATYKIRQKEFRDFPHMKINYMKAFDRLIKRRKRKGLSEKFETAQELFDWWIEEHKYGQIKGQMKISDFIK